MRAFRAALLVAVAGAHLGGRDARADERLDLQLPDVPLLEPAFHLDRDVPYDERTKSGRTYFIGIAGARADDGGTFDPQTGRTDGDARAAFMGSGALGLGYHSDSLTAAWRSELYGLSGRGVRGRHRGLVQGRILIGGDFGLVETVSANAEHGDARALAPVRTGPSERASGEAAVEVLVPLGKKKSDLQMVIVAGASYGGTAWETHDAPTLDSENHNTTMIGIAAAPADGELPRGRIDIVRLNIEGQRVRFRPGVMPIDMTQPIGPGNGGAETRHIDVLVGAKDMTLYIDHEMFAVFDAYLGGSWVEAENAAGTINDSLFNMRFATALKWKPKSDGDTRGLGVNISRNPTTTPDAQRILAEVRFELASSIESDSMLFGARAGISWLKPMEGGPTQVETLVRYGMEVEAFWKLPMGVEAGIYHANSFEPRVTGDPWATPRRWAVESGGIVRLRH
ncbi:MAG TPA: hypothetical protein VMZ53_32695 [Kofleriaceae bacterium]|nr:hypothetical protein [Kofleriaceae bacterium]